MKKYYFLHPDLLEETFNRVKEHIPDCLKQPAAFHSLYAAGNSMFFEVGDFEGVFWLSDIILGVSANAHIVLWGDEVKKKHGRAKEIVSDLINLLKLRRLSAYIPTFNEAACEYAEALGFTLEGNLRKFTYYNGELRDVSVFSLLSEEV